MADPIFDGSWCTWKRTMSVLFRGDGRQRRLVKLQLQRAGVKGMSNSGLADCGSSLERSAHNQRSRSELGRSHQRFLNSTKPVLSAHAHRTQWKRAESDSWGGSSDYSQFPKTKSAKVVELKDLSIFYFATQYPRAGITYTNNVVIDWLSHSGTTTQCTPLTLTTETTEGFTQICLSQTFLPYRFEKVWDHCVRTGPSFRRPSTPQKF